MARQITRPVGIGFAAQVGLSPQSGIRPIQLSDFRSCSPLEVFLTRMSEKLKAGVLQALCQGEAGSVLGDQGSMPWALAAPNFPPGRVEGQRGRAEFSSA